MNGRKKTIFYIASRGGHLTELLMIKPNLPKNKVKEFYITYDKDDSLENVIIINSFLLSQPIKIFTCFFKALYVTCKYKPDLIISTGAELAFPFIIISKIFYKTNVIYIECSAQVFTKSITGRFCYLFSDKFYVQWPSMLKVYGKKAEFKGGFLCSSFQ